MRAGEIYLKNSCVGDFKSSYFPKKQDLRKISNYNIRNSDVPWKFTWEEINFGAHTATSKKLPKKWILLIKSNQQAKSRELLVE